VPIPGTVKRWLANLEKRNAPGDADWFLTVLAWSPPVKGVTWEGGKAWDMIRITWTKRKA